MQAITTYASAFLETAGRRLHRPGVQVLLKTLCAGAAGLLFSAASLLGRAMPLSLGLVCAAPPGFLAVAAAMGGCIGYLLFWRELQGLAWMGFGLLLTLLAGDKPVARQQKLLFPALAAVVVSGCGLGFLLLFREDVPVGVYLLRVVVSSAATACFRAWRKDPRGLAGWLVGGMATLAAAQIAPHRFLSLGYGLAGFFSARAPLPMAVIAGLGLDLAQISKTPMTGVLCISCLPRLIPNMPKWVPVLCPALTYWSVSLLSGQFNPLPVPGLLLGGIAGGLFPAKKQKSDAMRRTGPTGLAQIRLERASDLMSRLEHSLLLIPEPRIDLRALLEKVQMDSCDSCPARKGCKARTQLTALDPEILDKPGLQTEDLPPGCKKQTRLLGHFRHQQAHLRAIRADRARQRACRSALADQYRFLGEYLQNLSLTLCHTHSRKIPRFRPEIGVSARALEEISGDRWAHFSPREDVAYFLLCDGMGTGSEAARDGQEALSLIQTMLEAGFSPEQALRCFNSLSALRFSGGSATVDLLKLDLCSGNALLFKWGSGPSYLLRSGQLKKIGTAGPPPGLSQQTRQAEYRLSLGGEDVLILLSDGAGAEGLARPQETRGHLNAGELAASILADGVHRGDDATVAVIRLCPLCPDTPYHIVTE